MPNVRRKTHTARSHPRNRGRQLPAEAHRGDRPGGAVGSLLQVTHSCTRYVPHLNQTKLPPAAPRSCACHVPHFLQPNKAAARGTTAPATCHTSVNPSRQSQSRRVEMGRLRCHRRSNKAAARGAAPLHQVWQQQERHRAGGDHSSKRVATLAATTAAIMGVGVCTPGPRRRLSLGTW